MSNKEREPGLIGVVADIIKVEKEYEIAIETALGGSIQNIVTDNEETAKRMIAFLKKKPGSEELHFCRLQVCGEAEGYEMPKR